MDHPQPTILDTIQTWIGGVVAVGTGVYAIWKGFRFSLRKAREVYHVLSQFANTLDTLTVLSEQVARVEARQQVFNSINRQPIWQSDLNGHCVEANAALLSLIGVSFEDIRGTGWAAYVHPDDRERVIREWEEAIQSKSRFRSRFRFVRPDGTPVSVDSRAFPVMDTHGEVMGFMGTDITDAH